jgi:hypothetical protein
MVAPPATTVAAMVLDPSQENPSEHIDKGVSEHPSAVSPLAASTTSPLDSFQANPHVQGDKPDSEQDNEDDGSVLLKNANYKIDKPDSEQDNDEDDDSVLPKTAKYKIGMFVIKEFDNISCAGVIHRVVYEQNTFMYSVSFFEVDLEETFKEDEITKHVFFYDDWIVMKDLDVFVTVGKAEHSAKIDSIVRLTDDTVDTTVLRVRWSNNFKDVVDISSVKPMHSTEHHNRRGSKKSPETKGKKTPSTTSSDGQKRSEGPVEDVSCPRKLLNGLSYKCKHYINCNSLNAKQKTAKMVEKSKRTPEEFFIY